MNKYCDKCGSKLKTQKIAAGYNPENGEQRHNTRVECPNYKRSRWGAPNGHYKNVYYWDGTDGISLWNLLPI